MGRATLALGALAFGAFSFVTAETLPIGLLTLIADDLDRSLSAIGLLVTGYAVVVVVASVPLTHLARRVRRRPLLGGLLALFSVTNLASAVAPDYWTLFGARLVTAVAQAVFWSVVTATAVGLFPREVRGRIVAAIAAGGSLAPVLGVPAATWVGQQAGWRVAFVVMAVVSVLTCAAVVILLPDDVALDGTAARGLTPDAPRYWVTVVVTALGMAGFFTTFTYVTAVLIEVSGFSAGALGPLLFVIGLIGLAGVVGVGAIADRYPYAVVVLMLGVLCVGSLGLAVFGAHPVPAVVCAAVSAAGLNGFAPAVSNRVMQVAPGSTDLANAGTSSAFNVGIAGGSLVGGAIVATVGVDGVALAGGLIAAGALLVLLCFGRSTTPGRRVSRSNAPA